MKLPAPDGDEPRVTLDSDTVDWLNKKPAPPLYNAYKCDTCHKVIVTVDIHRGVTPMFMACRRTPDCRGAMASSMYPDNGGPPPAHLDGAPRFEFFRPSATAYAALSREMQEHVNRGGLDIREAAP